MGSNSSSFDPEKYAEWSSSTSSYSEDEIKITRLILKAVPMTSTGKRVGLNILRIGTLGFAEIGLKGKRISHNVIEVITDKGPNYTLEWLDEIYLRCGTYGRVSPIDGERTYYPSNMTVSDLRSIVNNYPGSGDCKDHSYYWWEKIKQRY